MPPVSSERLWTRICAALFISAQLAAASFVFEFQLTAITTRGNCFGDDLTLACETYLSTFCLRLSTETSGCSLGSSGRHGPGGSLPITRQISSNSRWPSSFQLFIQARDEDNPGNDDDIDEIYISQSRAPSTAFTSNTEYLGNRNKVSVNLHYRIYCQENYYGTDCSTFCLAQDNDVNGHYTCNSADGSILCRDGFENPSNNCRDRITACSQSPCHQDAPCTPIDRTDYSCLCPAGYTGKNCEIEINECDPNPCQNNGNCTDLLDDYTCQCAAGYSGKNCSINTDDCAGVECRGNSTCIDEIDSYRCVCNLGFEGENCTEINPCDSSPCANSGSCIPLGPFNYTCECAPGFTGPECQVDIDECLMAICPENSYCVDAINSYFCVCHSGFGGEQCTPATTDAPVLQQTAIGNVKTAIIGAVIGVLIVVILIVILIIMVLFFVIRKGRSKERAYTLPSELTTTSTFTRADSHVYEQEDFKDGTVSPNPCYNTIEPKNAASADSSADQPLYSSISPISPDHSSTLRTVPNPMYGTQSPPSNSDGVYSLPMPQSSVKKDTKGTEEYPYAYARVETSRVSLMSGSGSVIRPKGEHTSPPQQPPPSYEYVSMAAAEAAKPELSEPAVTLCPSSTGNGNTSVVFKRSIYDDNFQYEVVNLNCDAPGDPKVPKSSPDLNQHALDNTGSLQSSHYDVPKVNATGTPRKLESDDQLTPVYGNIPNQPPYDKLDRGTDYSQPTSSVRLAKIEGSGYELLNKSS